MRDLLVPDDYPMTSSGKVQKYLLRQMAAGDPGRAGSRSALAIAAYARRLPDMEGMKDVADTN